MLKNNRGQTLYYFLIFTMILVISWAMMLNIAKIIRDRMIMQNTADNIALSIATHKARTMNLVANINYLIGTVLSLGTSPDGVQIPSYDTDKIAAYITGDTSKEYFSEEEKDVEDMKNIVEKLQQAQEILLKYHMTYPKTLILKYLAQGYMLTVPLEYTGFGLENAEKYFGIKRNMKGITYLTTSNLNFQNVHIVFNPLPITTGINFAELLKIPGYQFMKFVDENIPRNKHDKKDYSWYIEDSENMYKQKIKVTLTNDNITGSSSTSKPILGRILNISKPFITVRSASAIYNTKGTMFPESEDTNTGVADAMISVPYIVFNQVKIANFAKNLENLKVPPYVIGILTGYLESESCASFWKAYLNRNNPIDAYNDAKDGGWAAHLVPYNAEEENIHQGE